MDTFDADVIIAGAGMAGATLGLALAKAGLKPILIDPVMFSAQVAPTFDGRSSAIAYAAFRQWRALGLAPALEPLSQRIEHILVTDGRAPGPLTKSPGPFFLRFDAGEIADRCDGEPLGYMLENRHTRAALAEALQAQGVEVLAPARVAKAAVDARAATVTLADGRILRAPLVVGAEGRGSVIREAAGIEALGWDYRQTAVVATVKLERPHQGVAHEYFLPSGPFAILPLTGQRASLVWTESGPRAAALKAARPEVFHAHLQRRIGEHLGEARVEGPADRPARGAAGGRRPWRAPDRRPGPEPGPEGRRRAGRDHRRRRPAGRRHRRGSGAGALRRLATVRHRHALGRDGRLRAPVLERQSAAAPRPRPGHGRRQPHRPGEAFLHAGSRRRGRRPAAPAAG
jgi:ubiquinone biosynthesis UbiH/UbiF/VisC/COQ6 family hydroxylase